MGKEPGEILFEYLKAILFDTENASLDESSLPQEFHRLAEGLDFLALCVKEEKEFANELFIFTPFKNFSCKPIYNWNRKHIS